MIRLSHSLRHWPSPEFDRILKAELEALPAGSLPLEQGLTRCGSVDDSNISAMVISSSENEGLIQCRVGIFFTEIVAGCVCGEEPAPENAHCELLISIDKTTAAAAFEIIPA